MKSKKTKINQPKELARPKDRKSTGFLRWIFDIILIFTVAFVVFYLTNRAGHSSLSGDSYAHATRLKFFLQSWPHINWFPQWGAGLPLFLWYGISPFYLMAGLAKILGSIKLALVFWPVLCFALVGLGSYGLVYELTKNRMAALISAFLAIPLPALWYRALVGTHSRMIGTSFLILSLWFLVKLIKNYLENNKKLKKSVFVGFIILTTVAMQAHIFSAALALFFEGVFILILIPGFKEKFKFALKVWPWPILIAAYFLFPFVLTQGMSEVSQGSNIGFYYADPIILKLFLYHNPNIVVMAGGGLSPIHLPLLFIFFLAVLFSRNIKGKSLVNRTALALFLLTLSFVLFGTAIYFGFPANWYNTGFVPDEAFEFIAILLPSLIGLLFYYSFRNKVIYRFASVLLLITIGTWIYWQYPIKGPFKAGSPNKLDPQNVYNQEAVNSVMKDNLDERQFRFAHPTTEISLWFNYEYDIPQTREYFPQGVLYPNWKSWFENAIWDWKDNIREVKFLNDWFSIKWIMLYPFNIADKFKADAEDYKLTSENLNIYEYKKASPILAPNNSPRMLVIGSRLNDRSFSPILRGLSFANYNSQKVIPFRAHEFIDDYSLKELSKFEVVLLYEYRFHNQKKALDLLAQYVEQGGGLIIETSSFGEVKNLKDLSAPFPVSNFKVFEKNQDWNFKLTDSQITKDINFINFSKADFEGSPWKVFTPKSPDEIKPGAEVILSSGDDPVLITYQLGKGRVIWSGLNLPYHIVSYKNKEEAKFLGKLIDWAAAGGKTSNNDSLISGEVKTVNPEKREVVINEPVLGVLFKENYFFNWQAYIESGGHKQKAKVYDAGPDMMYVFIPQNPSLPLKVTLLYKKSWAEMFSNFVSLAALLTFLVYIFEGKFFKPILPKLWQFAALPLKKVFRKTSKWWAKEDEE